MNPPKEIPIPFSFIPGEEQPLSIQKGATSIIVFVSSWNKTTSFELTHDRQMVYDAEPSADDKFNEAAKYYAEKHAKNPLEVPVFKGEVYVCYNHQFRIE